MGLLDEAIKQHLDLKRRRGADPGEIERLEREALGPVRRLQQEPPAEAAAVPADRAEAVYEDEDYAAGPYEEDEFGPEDDYELEDEELEFEPPERGAAAETAARSRPDADDLGAHGVVPPEDPLEDEPNSRVQPRRAQSEPAEPDEHLGIETAEYDVEAEHARDAESQPGGEEGDPLEETPEFFQDAPDHDRLWFEQRPPKDFDFEG